MDTVNVPAHALPYLEGRFADFAKRAKRLRKPAPELTVHRIFVVWVDAGENRFGEPVKRRVEMAEVSVTGQRPKLAAWEPVANLVHANGANVVRAREGFSLPETFRTRQVCDHCGHNRRRNDTWVLRHTETGELRQIGRQCMQDFIGSDDVDPAALAMWADAWQSVSGDEDFIGGGGRHYFGVGEYLAAVAAVIREARGIFISKKVAAERGGMSTAEQAFCVLTAFTAEEKKAWPTVTADDVETANNGLAWCAEWTEAGDYPHNVRTAVGMGYVTHKTAGFVASLLGAAWPNAMKKDAEKASKPVTRHFPAEAGKRVTTTVDVVKVRGWQGDFGWTTFVEMRDGEVALNWYASGSVDVKEGDRVTIKGTIKKHGTDRYTAGAVTTLTRCKVIEKVS